jgi:signal peptidase I
MPRSRGAERKQADTYVKQARQEKQEVFSGGQETPLLHLVEFLLSRRKAIRRVKKEQQKKKHWLLDWVEAFLWAAGWVLIINQYLLQAYVIPSGSMIDTLLVGDHIVVNKIIYGPELLPSLGKLPSPIKPKRNEIIIFENPAYISRGAVFDIAQRILYMLTLSIIDIDKDDRGEPRVHFLIKRAVGMSGDTFINDRGNMLIVPAGAPLPVSEAGFNAANGYKHNLPRLMESGDYASLEAAGRAYAYQELGLTLPEELLAEARQNLDNIRYPDMLTHEAARLAVLHAADPPNIRYSVRLAQFRQGWHVPEGRILPLGDNRDNSRDGRYFGPVRMEKILGKGSINYWPGKRTGGSGSIVERLSRIGSIK